MSTLHVTNGDDAATKLRRIVDGPVLITADVLHDGPAPDVALDEWHELRAKYLSGGAYPFDEVRRSVAECDAALADTERYDRLVLWFEHDLFDQLLLVRALDLVRHPRASLICIDRYPGVDRFIGLGQLTDAQLATLIGTERPITTEQVEFARAAWRAFRAANPTALNDLVRGAETPRNRDPLPFVRAALRRFVQEYPSTRDGLSRSAHAALVVLRHGSLDGGSLFAATQAREEAPFMGDRGFFTMLRELEDVRVPLVSIEPRNTAVDLRRHTIAVTAAGRDVVAGRVDAVALNGIDTWRGGVHLHGSNGSPWRWDEGAGTLVS